MVSGQPARVAGMRRVNIDELRELLKILDERGVAEFELEEGGRKLRIRKSAGEPSAFSSAGATAVSASPALAAPQAATPPAKAAAAPSSAPAAADEGAAGQVVMTSPIVGTFYRSPDPNSPVFVNVGDRVKVGQVLCIVEAMKLMNEIEAEAAGEVVKIHPENGQPVQYGDPLFTLRLDR
jgi:acetyl-CoA carboxylase biotin carboxyl carrier protein